MTTEEIREQAVDSNLFLASTTARANDWGSVKTC